MIFLVSNSFLARYGLPFMILSAYAGPTPAIFCSSSAEALLISMTSPAGAAAAFAGAGAFAVLGAFAGAVWRQRLELRRKRP